jgi:hypothetical protein
MVKLKAHFWHDDLIVGITIYDSIDFPGWTASISCIGPNILFKTSPYHMFTIFGGRIYDTPIEAAKCIFVACDLLGVMMADPVLIRTYNHTIDEYETGELTIDDILNE